MSEPRPPLPPFSEATAVQKIRAAEDAWNSRDPERVSLDYRLIEELWAFTGNRLAVRFAYEYHDDSGNWFRAYGNENWDRGGPRPKRIPASPSLACDRGASR